MKKVGKLLSVLIVVMLISGCAKYDIGMTIGKDKSFTIEIISAIQSEYSSYSETDEETEAVEAKGFTVEDYNDGEYVGAKYTKQYKSIDEVSGSESVIVDLYTILDEDTEDIEVYFKKSSSLFKSTYTATFTVDLSDESEYSSYGSSMDLSYHVTLPVVADSNDATSVSEDGLTYTWDLEYGKLNEINYSFTMSSFDSNIIIVVVIAIVAVVAVVVISKNKKGNNNPNMNSNINYNNQMPMNNMPNMTNNIPEPIQPEVQPQPEVKTPNPDVPTDPNQLNQ